MNITRRYCRSDLCKEHHCRLRVSADEQLLVESTPTQVEAAQERGGQARVGEGCSKNRQQARLVLSAADCDKQYLGACTH